MAIVVQLVDNTPFALVYLCTQDGVVSSPPVAADGLFTIPNTIGGATPNLDTDSIVNTGGAGGLPLNRLIDARNTGYGPIAAGALTQAQARALFARNDLAGTVLTNFLITRAYTTITPRTGMIVWGVDWNVDAQGDPVCEVRSATGTASTAMLKIAVDDSPGL
jgi:hypothetical protein